MGNSNRSYTKKELLQNKSFLRWRYFPTEDDKLFWEKLRKDPAVKAEIEDAIEILDAVRFNDYSLSDEESGNMLNTIEIKIRNEHLHRRRKLFIAISSAAAVVLLLVLSLPLLIKHEKTQVAEVTDVYELMENNKDIQIIMGDESLAIDKDADFLYNESGDMTILKENERILENKKVETTRMNKLIVPKGKRSMLTLSDGTKIWVNSGSILEFPAVFQGSTREIKVEGEIYLEVAENKIKPFIVNTSEVAVKVLGTQFNVSAYKDDQSSFVVLVEGAVEITSETGKVDLLPEQMASVTRGNIKTEKVDVYNYISWKDGLMQFDNEPLSNITTRLMRYYDKTILCEDGTADLKYTGKLVLFDNVEDVLETITNMNPVKYIIINDTIYISKE